MTPVRASYSDTYYCETPEPSMRKLPVVAQRAVEGGLATLVEPAPVTREDLEKVHHRRYVKSILSGRGELADCAFGFWSEAYRDGVLAINGGNLLAARMALEDGIAANIGGGFHHACHATGAGYCTFNGLALTAAMNPGLSILVIDCDEHTGDGTAELTERIPNLTNFSICGSMISCPTGPRSIVREVPPHDEKAALRFLLQAIDFAASSKPDLIIYQAGMDPHRDDPLSRSKMSPKFLEKRDRLVMSALALDLKIPFFFVLAGGYQEPMEERLVPLHLKTFEAAAQIRARM